MASDLAHSIATLAEKIVERRDNTDMPKSPASKPAHIKKSGSIEEGDGESLEASERGGAVESFESCTTFSCSARFS